MNFLKIYSSEANGCIKMGHAEIIDTIKCLNCESTSHLPYNELYDEEGISLKCECLSRKTLFQINYRAVNIDRLKDKKTRIMIDFHEALSGVTSYYHYSQGDRKKYIEKKITSIVVT
ncbi:TPA: hypothetical protein DCX16_03450, partial [bacterium]|nr:hypothetical protein [bacterium]